MNSQINIKITDVLERDLSYADFAFAKLEKEMKSYEKKYMMGWRVFMAKFEKGTLGDETVWFDWYSLATGAKDWEDTKKAIEKAIRIS